MNGTSLLRVYDPPECDKRGVPLDWERCRTCEGHGSTDQPPHYTDYDTCLVCGGQGSLRGAVLNHLRMRQMWKEVERRGDLLWPQGSKPRPSVKQIGDLRREIEAGMVLRCEGCHHPMGEDRLEDGLWVPTGDGEEDRRMWHRYALKMLIRGIEPNDKDFLVFSRGWTNMSIHLSSCDRYCRHGGELRVHDPRHDPVDRIDARGLTPTGLVGYKMLDSGEATVKASWRHVDIRMSGWPHDLDPDKMALLCLRCHAKRAKES